MLYIHVALFAILISFSTTSALHWQSITTPPENTATTGGAVACAQDLCYITGGFSGGAPSNQVIVYNVTDKTSSIAIPMITPRGGHSAVIVWSDENTYTVWVIAGQSSKQLGPAAQLPNADVNDDPPGCGQVGLPCPAWASLSEVEFFDPLVGFWQSAPPYVCCTAQESCTDPPQVNCGTIQMDQGVSMLSCVTYKQEIWCFGGVTVIADGPDGDMEFSKLDVVGRLDTANFFRNPPNSVYWNLTQEGTLTEMPMKILQHSVSVYGNNAYINGGSCGTILGNCGTEYPIVPPEEEGHSRNLQDGGRRLQPPPEPFTCDDSKAMTSWASNNTWEFNFVNMTWTKLPDMRFGRCSHGTFVDSKNHLLYSVGGSFSVGEAGPEVEVLDLHNISNGWSRGPLLPQGVQSFAMTTPTFFNSSKSATNEGLIVIGPLGGDAWSQSEQHTLVVGYEGD